MIVVQIVCQTCVYRSLQNELKLYLLICLVDDGLEMPSSIYDPIRTVKRVIVVFIGVKTLSTHYQGDALLLKWLFVYVFIHK